MTNIFSTLIDRWKAIARSIGVFQTRLFLLLFYYVFMVPFALIVAIFKDPLSLKKPPPSSNWLPRITRDHSLNELKQQD